MPYVLPEGPSLNSTKSLVSGKNSFSNLRKRNVRSSAGSGKPRSKLCKLKQHRRQQQQPQVSKDCTSICLDRISLEVKMIVRFRRVHHCFFISISMSFMWPELLKQQPWAILPLILIARIVSAIAAVTQLVIGALLESYPWSVAASWVWCRCLSLLSLSLSRFVSTWSEFSLLWSMVLSPRSPWSERAETARFDFNREIPKIGIQGKIITVWWPMRKGGLLIESIARVIAPPHVPVGQKRLRSWQKNSCSRSHRE